MTSPSPHFRCELQIRLAPDHTELLRSFVREAALAEAAPLACASLLADDCVGVWQALCGGGEGRAHASVSLRARDAVARLTLTGHARFARVISTLEGSRRPGGGLSCRESGINGWEISLHRPLFEANAIQLDPATGDQPPVPDTADDIRVELARKEDAPGIARCFLEVYGHHYVHADVFSPRRYWAGVEAGALIPVVARNGRGDVIGHLALEREAGAMVAERGEAVVLPSYRGHHLLERMTDRLSEEAASHGLIGIYAEPLTIHTFSQRNDVRAGMPVCAVLLGANPESFRPQDIACPTAGQRQSYLRTFRFVTPPPARSIASAGPYEDVVRQIYERLGVTISPSGPAEPQPSDSNTRLSVNARGYGAIRFTRIGSSCAVELAQALRDVRSLGAATIRLSAPMADPGLPSLIEAARGQGFIFCGLAPAFADGDDLLLLQFLTEPLDCGKLQLFTEEARHLVAFIDHDRAR